MLHMHDLTILEQLMGECCPIFFWSDRLTKQRYLFIGLMMKSLQTKPTQNIKNISQLVSVRQIRIYPNKIGTFDWEMLPYFKQLHICQHWAKKNCLMLCNCPLWGWYVWAYISGCISNICLSMARSYSRWDTVSVSLFWQEQTDWSV